MRYLGGKSRIAKHLAEVIDSVRHPGQWVWDAFCGGLSMSVALSKKGPVWSTDANAALIALYRAIQSGWEPPTEVSKETWHAAKALPDSDPLKAFCGFGCSFGGKWFGGYAGRRAARAGDPKLYTFRDSTANGLRRECPGRVLAVVDFLSVQPQACEAILYLDPPYAGTTGYAAVAPFDSDRFVQRVREWSRFTHVFVSEYSFPIGECVWSRQVPGSTQFKKDAVERLYYLGPG